MPLLLTLDASVFVAACHPQEPGHTASQNLLDQLSSTGLPLIEPSILPVEVAAALRLAGASATLAREFAESILALPHLTVVDLGDRLARQAVVVAAHHQLRGADALYVTTALRYGKSLVTLDREQLQRAPRVIHARNSDAAIALLTP